MILISDRGIVYSNRHLPYLKERTLSEYKHLHNSFVYKTIVLFRLKNRSFEIFLKSLFVISIFINNFSKLNRSQQSSINR